MTEDLSKYSDTIASLETRLAEALTRVEAREAEIAKLREVLEGLLEWFDYNASGKHPYLYMQAVLKARAALGIEQEYARKLLGGREEK